MDREHEQQISPEEGEGTCCGADGFVRNETDKKRGSRFTLICAFSCAWCGLSHAVRTQRNMRIHLGVALVAVLLGLVLQIDGPSWCAVALCIAGVFASECFNTALEAVVDLVSPNYHELARTAKDCAAAAVLVVSFTAVVVAAIVFVPRVVALF